MASFADRAIDFYANLQVPGNIPGGTEVLNPYASTEVTGIVQNFFYRYYNDNEPRILLLGINPGRLGAGITGISFTDPVRLEDVCGIPNSFEKKSELSSRFVYDVIEAYGGPERFFSKFFLSAVSPLGFTRSGKNLNYYDARKLEDSLGAYILETLKKQCHLGIHTGRVISLGEGKNLKYLERINRENGLFGIITGLPHPRWVMQYRFKRKDEYIQKYLEVLEMF